jgi:hypothetical protein
MDNVLDTGNLLSRGHLTYCVEYAQAGALDKVTVYPVIDAAKGASAACIAAGDCAFDTTAPAISVGAGSVSVAGVTGALYEAIKVLPVEGEITLVGHSQGGFITRDLSHRYYDELRWRGKTINRVINLGHPHFGKQFDPALYAPFLCIEQPDSFDCKVGQWLWGWKNLLGSGIGPTTIDNSDLPQIQWNVVSGEGAAGLVGAEPQGAACVEIFGGIDETTVVGDSSVPIESSLGRDEFNFFPGPNELDVDARRTAAIGVSHNGASMLNDFIANFPQQFPAVTPSNLDKTALAFYQDGASVALPNAGGLIRQSVRWGSEQRRQHQHAGPEPV